MPSVKGSPANARTLESSFRRFQGVYQVDANPVTGSLLIHYDPEAINMDWLAAMVPAAQRPPVAQRVATAVTSYVVQSALEKAAKVLIAAAF